MKEGIPDPPTPREAVGHVARNIAGLTRRLEEAYIPLADFNDDETDRIFVHLVEARDALAKVTEVVGSEQG